MDYQAINATTIDRWVKDGWTWGQPIDHQTYVNAQHGDWSMVLTPKKPIPRHWFFPEMRGKRFSV